MDTHVVPGYTVPANYDSMIAKLIVHADDREQCISRMTRAPGRTAHRAHQTLTPPPAPHGERRLPRGRHRHPLSRAPPQISHLSVPTLSRLITPLLAAASILAAPCLFTAASCAPRERRTAGPFLRDSMTPLSRSVAGARDAIAAARDAALESALHGHARRQPGNRRPRHLHAHASRPRPVTPGNRSGTHPQRLRQPRAFVEDWQRDIRNYSSDALRRQAREELSAADRAADTLLKSLDAAAKSFTPVIDSLRDDSLFLKQRRTIKPDMTPVPRDDPQRAASLQILLARTDAAVAACEEFLETVPRSPTGAAQSTEPSPPQHLIPIFASLTSGD